MSGLRHDQVQEGMPRLAGSTALAEQHVSCLSIAVIALAASKGWQVL